tara:strand:+ start:6592 stop:7482 length:891 start_codon:yes stop_codon:yes gene_type:complete
MNITRVNPDWHWKRATQATVKDGVIELGSNLPEWRPSYESPALHRTLANTYDEILSSNGHTDAYTQAFLRRFGWIGANELFTDAAATVWWLTRVLDVIAADGINPEDVTLSEADDLMVTVPNPLRIVPKRQQEITQVGDDGAQMTYGTPRNLFIGMVWRINGLTVEDDTWTTSYSGLIAWAHDLINEHLVKYTTVQYESLWNFKRDRHGVRKATEGFDATHRFQRAVQPVNLLGYIWLCIADQFEAGNKLEYYKCAEYENGYDCRQELVKKVGTTSRREYCGEGCRAKAKRRRDAK